MHRLRGTTGMETTRSRSLPGVTVAAVIASLVAASSCAAIDETMVAFRSTDGFVASPADPRVAFEPGAEALAASVVAALPGAIAQVEDEAYGPFTVPVRIYVCGTLDCYRRFTGNQRSGGHTSFRRKIFISPKPENTAARVPSLVAHELTHLHLTQRCSSYRASRLPIWFSEGFATLVSHGGGAEDVSAAAAARAIAAGSTFTPTTSRGQSGSAFGLAVHTFYRQAALFIDHLRAADGDAFRAFVRDLEDGRPFTDAFEGRLRTPLLPRWRAFVAELATREVSP